MSDVLDAEASENEGPDIKQLRALAKKGEKFEEAQAKATALEQEIAIMRSGIDADTPLGKMFLKGYDGDLTDVEAVKAQAAELGIPFKEGSAPVKDAPLEPTGTEERQALAAEAVPDEGKDQTDPNELAVRAYDEAMKTGKTNETAEAAFIGTIAGAAHAGDPRVIWTPPNG